MARTRLGRSGPPAVERAREQPEPTAAQGAKTQKSRVGARRVRLGVAGGKNTEKSQSNLNWEDYFGGS
jgi:hypothetical protein